jgi:hypothetical protein
MEELIVRPDAETGSTTALANMSEEIYERLTTVFKYTKFDVCRSLENGTITISKLMYDAYGEFKADIDIEFDARNVTITGLYDGCPASIDDVTMSTESDDVDSIYEKIEDAICVEYGKIAENEMRGVLLQYYKE